MSKNLDNVDNQQLDIFKEIGNIGAGNAVTSLSLMLGKELDMSVPDVKIVPFNDIINILNGPESLVAGMLVNMSGDLKGYLLMVLEPKDAYQMVSLAGAEPLPPPKEYDIEFMNSLDSSALSEIANILLGAYLSAICTLTNLSVMPSVPQLSIDMVGAILSIVAIEYGQIGDSVLFLETNFKDTTSEISGSFFMIPDFESYSILMKSLGID